VSLFARDYHGARAAGRSDADLRALLADHGIRIAELDPLLNWMPGLELGAAASADGRDFFAHGEADFYAIADALGARSINAVLFSDRGFPLEALAEAFAALCDRAREHGLLVHLEFMPFAQVCDVRVAEQVVRLAGRENGGILLDSWHHFRSGARDAAIPAGLVNGIQISDAPAKPEADPVAETTRRRLLPGEGAIDLAGLLAGLAAGGCRAPIGVEVFSDVLAARPTAETARRVAEAARAVMRGLPRGGAPARSPRQRGGDEEA
jgi:sugar phosphate isomerase/epimerase